MVLGVTDTSQTGPSYSPLGTPLSSASCILRTDTTFMAVKTDKDIFHPQRGTAGTYYNDLATSCIAPPAFHKTIIDHYKKLLGV